jgi:hypothetical protein
MFIRYYNPKADLTAETAFNSSHGNNFTETDFSFLLPLLNTFVTVSQGLPMCP